VPDPPDGSERAPKLTSGMCRRWSALMVPLIVLLTVVVFLLVDWALRTTLTRRQAARVRRERAAALDIGLKLQFAEEAKSLKRVTVDHPKARILAVDDEPVVLDSFRRILVLEGYSVDTVETGPEALSLVRKNDYDFVFTDLKMPVMDGIEVTKAVNHLRPDIDIVIITGYATIESAVETMKHGARDYAQKPFTAEELAALVNKLLIRRQARIEEQAAPSIHLVTATSGELPSRKVINVPGGAYVAPQHTWVSIEMSGEARVGLDDFTYKTLPGIADVVFPREGQKIARGETLFSIKRGDKTLEFPSPLSGVVSRVNHELAYHLDLLRLRPMGGGWICRIVPSDLAGDLRHLRIGADAIDWYKEEMERYRQRLKAIEPASPLEERAAGDGHDARAWDAFSACFLEHDREPAAL
jgi:CheY-like chemotaxis protein/glycine cleavage system H lipoate-binding protein